MLRVSVSAAVTEVDNSQGAMAVRWAQIADSGAAITASAFINRREQIAPFCTPRMTSSVAGSPLPDAKQVPGGILDCRDPQVAL